MNQTTRYPTWQSPQIQTGCRNGPRPKLGGRVVVPRMMVKRGPGLAPAPKHRRTEDNHGTLCRHRRVFGTLECLHRGCGGKDRETKIASDPDALVAFFKSLACPVARIGLEAGPLSQWLYAGLAQAGFETVHLETRHVKAALSALVVKTDRKDARGIAQLIRMGWFRPVHCKSPGSQEVRALLVARKQLLGKLLDIEFSIRGILRGFGLKMGIVTRKSFEERARELNAGQVMLETVVGAMLAARTTLQTEYTKLHKSMLAVVHDDDLCRRMMTAPGVGPVVAITFKTAVDDPKRISKSKAVGALFGLTPKKYQSRVPNGSTRMKAASSSRMIMDSVIVLTVAIR
jgi:transposase